MSIITLCTQYNWIKQSSTIKFIINLTLL